ncbi:MAG: hypothetical protein ABR906_03560 [Terracidiphilus sp.]|jgi:hypothetical protein
MGPAQFSTRGPDKAQMHFDHFNFDFSAAQILWTLTFAAQLILLVVLLGRDRARRYPWFTAVLVMFTLQQMAERLLTGRLATLPLQATLITMADLALILSLLVLVEVARRGFAGASRLIWINGTLALVVVAGGAVAAWGPWVAWARLTANHSVMALNLMLLAAAPKNTLLVALGLAKGDLLAGLLTVEVGLLMVLFGRRFKAGWRSHTQMIAIGLWTAATSWLAMQGVWEYIARTAHFHNRAEYDQVVSLEGKLINANSVVFLAVLLWWIVWLWLEEPGTAKLELVESPVEEEPLQTAE